MDKEKEILAAALKLFVEFGFHGTPTSKIAKEAGVANGTLFHYFKTKEDLIVGLYIRIKENLNGYLLSKVDDQSTLETRMKTIYEESLQWALIHRDEFYFIQQFHFSPHLAKVSAEDIEKQTRLHVGLLGEGVKSKIFKSLPVGLIGTILGSQLYGVYQYLVSNDLSASKQKQVIDETFVLLWEMITNIKQ
ncbi:TetR/AcrR family transcriptional regulator [Dyadobacter frigoris]|uniref:TetR/AcrR family transcriptional regulator n=1 Tax=Dyadobacter frigoris TaxID=2576211 RepID=A0A4U6D5X9_9BACT|nr:TetR/AcrR family transcriptional regulator [Dyadobacter frigoris]TKT92779.1 TetR/AcrR family transcriptional regulator [Dyadobacter frigoris]GLU51680.1 TetR family transcriptional regulator [Dyadobacter frigoris]